MKENQVKPFLKWAGGKSQILEEIRKKYPETIIRYCEPFVGGGAVLWDILEHYHPEAVLINDINPDLINAYRQIQKNYQEVAERLQEMQTVFHQADSAQRKELFQHYRGYFNAVRAGKMPYIPPEMASVFIFLNKTCFNGLFRVNSRGDFNVPMGDYKKPLICDKENLSQISRMLSGVEIRCGDYRKCLDFINSETFVYIDPPYRPLTNSAKFTSYSSQGFDDKEQIALARFIDTLKAKGAKITASNSDPKNSNSADNFFDDLYHAYQIERISAKRNINCNGNGRGAVRELLISN